MAEVRKKAGIFLYIALLLLVVPLVHSKTAVYGTIVHRTIYFWGIIDVSLLLFIIRQKGALSHTFNWLQISLLIYTFICFLSAIFGYDIYLNLFSGFERMTGFLSLMHLVLFFFVFSQLSFSDKELNILLGASMLIGLLISLFGIEESINGKHERAESLLSNPMHFSVYVLIQVYMGIYAFYRWKNPLIRILCMAYILIIASALLFTQTRAGIIALGISLSTMLLVYLYQQPRKKLYMAYALLFILAVAGVFWFGIETKIQIFERFSEAGTLDVRLKLWGMCLQNSLQHPFLGWGQGSFIYFYFTNFTSNLNDAGNWYDSAHNNLIDAIISTGYLGFFAYCAVFCCSFYSIWHKGRHNFSNTERIILTGFLVAYLTFMFFGFESLISSIILFAFFCIVQKNSPILASFSFSLSGNFFKAGKVLIVLAAIVAVYFFVYKSIRTNKLLSQAYQQNDVEQKINLYNTAYAGALIGEYDVALEFALENEKIFNSNLPADIKEKYYGNVTDIVKQSLALHYNNPILLNQKGFVEMASGRTKEAIKTFELMSNLSPNRLINNHDYAWMLFKDNQIDKSISVLDKVIKKQEYNKQAVLLKARIYFESQMPEKAFEALKIFTPKEIVQNFKEITDLIFEYRQYKPFYPFLYHEFVPDNIGDLVLTEEQLLTWAQIAQLSKDKEQVYSVFSYYSGNTLLGANGLFRRKEDSLRVRTLINKVYEGTENYDVILSLKDF